MTPELILGGPGCGKTTALLAVVEGLFKQGIAPDKVAYLAFTRKAAQEAKTRAESQFGYTNDDLPYFRTIHSFAFKMLEMTSGEVMAQKHYQELGQDIGFSFGEVDQDLGLPLGAGRGDRMSHAEQTARVRGITLKQVCLDQGQRYWDVKLYADSLKHYKESRYLMDFTDMLEEYERRGPVPQLEAVIIDEGQDLSPLQWRVVEKIARGAERVYVAGDDDQAIYKWAGADVDHFLTLDGPKRVLPISYRLSRQVFVKCQEVLRQIGHRYEKDWAPSGHDGTISRYSRAEYIDYTKGSWLCLARNKYMLAAFRDIMHTKGFPYVIGGRSSVANGNVSALLAWEALRRGKFIDVELIKGVYKKMMPGCIDQAHRALAGVEAEMLNIEQLEKQYGLNTRQDWMQVLRIPSAQREYYRAIRQRGESLIEVPRITVSTIHAVKGGEADQVALFTDMATASHDEYMRQPDSEARCFYVGVSRARYGLHLMHPQSSRSFPL